MVKQSELSNPVWVDGYPDELLDRRYVVNRDEILWREYTQYLARGDHVGVNSANRVLRIIRDAPD